jgi:hypothetical protein
MRRNRLLSLLLVAGLLTACGGPEQPAEIPAPDGPRGGWVISLAPNLLAEILPDTHTSELELYLVEKDRKTPKPVAALPVLVVQTQGGERKLSEPTPGDMLEGTASNFVFRDESLRADVLRGRLEIELDGKKLATPFATQHICERDH